MQQNFKNILTPKVAQPEETECSCVPVNLLKSDIDESRSPFGDNDESCFQVDSKLVYKNNSFVNGKTNLLLLNCNVGFQFSDSVVSSVLDEWEIDTFVAGSRDVEGKSKESLMNEFSKEIESCVDHEQKVSSQGVESEYIRTSAESEEVARKYMIMNRLHLNKNLRQNRNEAPFQQKCINLTKEFREANSECLSQPCDPTFKHRSIDGCCNNLENPSHGMPSTAFLRLLPSEYSDGVSLPRGGLTSSSLPQCQGCECGGAPGP